MLRASSSSFNNRTEPGGVVPLGYRAQAGKLIIIDSEADNMKTAVETVFIGKDRQFIRLRPAWLAALLDGPPPLSADVWPLPGRAHRLHAGLGLGKGAGREPGRSGARALLHAAAAGGELRGAKRPRLLERCVAYAKAHKHPELTDLTIWQAFEAERPQLVQITGPIDGFHATQVSVSKTCLVRFDNHKYSVAARAVGRPVEIQAYADRVVILRTASERLHRHKLAVALANKLARICLECAAP
jgi:Mu transposase, C-terminal domain